MFLLPYGVGEGHDGVGHELQLILEHRVLLRQFLPAGAEAVVFQVVGGLRTVGVSALEVVLPKFCNISLFN